MTTSAEILNPDVARQVAWIAYINGLEVPVVSASVSYGVWQIPQCQLVMVPDPVLQRLGAEDRITAQVFYCDYWHTPGNPQFRLMYDGEIVGWGYTNTPGGRSIVFNCVDYIQMFTQLFFFFMSSVDDIAIGASGTQIGVSANMVQLAGFGAVYPYSLFTQGLASPGPTPEPSDSGEPLITRPIDFLYNVVKSFSKEGHFNKAVTAANFFAPWTKRTNFHKRFIALPFLEESGLAPDGSPIAGVFPLLRAVNQDQAIAAVARMASDIGKSGSVWAMFQTIMQTLMMEICMLPTAACVDSDFGTPPAIDSDGNATRNSGQGKGLDIKGPAKPSAQASNTSSGRSSGFNFLTQYFVKPQFIFGLPPACNVFYPPQISTLGYEENYITQPTRTYFNVDNLIEILHAQPGISPGLLEVMRNNLSVAHPEEVNQLIRQSVNNGLNGKNLLVYPEEFFKGPVMDRRTMPRWFAYLQQASQGLSATPQPTNRQVSPGDNSRDVYRLYAAYEYHKERYSNRTGGIQMAFNPYPVPGFPCAAFDRRSSKVDVVGYIMSVQQFLSDKGWSTNVSYSYGRTLKEVFQLLTKQFSLENTSLSVSKPDIASAVKTASDPKSDESTAATAVATLNNTADPIGAIAMAPPEPLVEIRDVIQNLDRAEQFYRSLFYREAAPKSAAADEAQLQAEAQRNVSFLNARTVESISANDFVLNTGLADQYTKPQIDLDTQSKTAVFYYPDIIELVDDKGKTENIAIVGTDASSKLKIINGLIALKAGTINDSDLAYIRTSLERPNLDMQRGTGGTPEVMSDDGLLNEVNNLEVDIRTTPTYTNLAANKQISVKSSASHLFESYDAAMRYNSRPICTLEEYIDFLGDDGIRVGKIAPQDSGTLQGTRWFPAVYYAQIRAYRAGPPPEIPPAAITHSPILTNIDGMSDQAVSAPSADTVTGLPADFPENRDDWTSILLQYRDNVLYGIAPRT